MKPRTYRAILIDPEGCSIAPVEITGHSQFNEMIGCDLADGFRLSEHATSWAYGYVDDNGLKRGEPIHAFLFDIRRDPLAGKCLIVGTEKDSGYICDLDEEMTPAFLRDHIQWLGVIKPEVVWDKTEFGERAIVLYEKVSS